jgi:cytoskeletal protein RodZ
MESIKNFFKKSWGWMLLVPAAILTLIVLFWKNGKGWFKLLLAIRESSQQEVEDIKSVREKELEDQRKNKEKIDKMLVQIQQKHDKEDTEFNENKRKQVEETVKTYGGDPNKLAEELAKVTGFKVVLPPED